MKPKDHMLFGDLDSLEEDQINQIIRPYLLTRSASELCDLLLDLVDLEFKTYWVEEIQKNGTLPIN